MTRGSILEYVEAIRGRYLSVSRKEKGRILDEFTNVTSLHRKAAVRLLHRRGQAKVRRKRGRPSFMRVMGLAGRYSSSRAQLKKVLTTLAVVVDGAR